MAYSGTLARYVILGESCVFRRRSVAVAVSSFWVANCTSRRCEGSLRGHPTMRSLSCCFVHDQLRTTGHHKADGDKRVIKSCRRLTYIHTADGARNWYLPRVSRTQRSGRLRYPPRLIGTLRLQQATITFALVSPFHWACDLMTSRRRGTKLSAKGESCQVIIRTCGLCSLRWRIWFKPAYSTGN